VALGGIGLSAVDLATLYAGLARGGEVAPLAVLRDRASEPATPLRLVGASAAWQIADVLSGAPLPNGYASMAGAYAERRLAFKTGTSYGFRDAWAAGYSRNWTVVVWAGHADGTPRPGRYGREDALPVMLKAFARLPAEDPPDLRPPPGTLVVAANRDLPPSLRFATSAAARLQRATAPIDTAQVKPPRILWPASGSVIEIGEADGQFASIPLQAEGGRGRLRWMVDGVPLAAQPFRATPLWTPGGVGAAHLSVIDDEGRVASVEVRISRIQATQRN
jgi:penicillin-binding protein 1C